MQIGAAARSLEAVRIQSGRRAGSPVKSIGSPTRSAKRLGVEVSVGSVSENDLWSKP